MTRSVWAAAAMALLMAACGGGSGGGGSNTGTGPEGSGPTGSGPGPGTPPAGAAALYADFRASKHVILQQRVPIAITPATFKERFASMESTLDAFDGVMLRLPLTSDAVTRSAALDGAALAADLAPLSGLAPSRLKFNFATFTVRNDLDVFDDWTTAIANVGKFARAARDAGMVGIVVDNEDLSGLRVNYPADVKFPDKSADQYRSQTQAIGRQIMQAIVANFADAVVVVMRGPAGAEAKAPASVFNCESRDPNAAFPQQSYPYNGLDTPCGDNTAILLGPFFAGFVEGGGSASMLVDGGTDYGLRTADQFAASATFRKTTIAQAATGAPFMSPVLRSGWTGVRATFGVREGDGAHGISVQNDNLVFASTLAQALIATDHFVWTSFDLTDMTRVASTNATLQAVRNGRAAAFSGTRLLPATAATGTGLMAQYFAQADESELAQTVLDPTIDSEWNDSGPAPLGGVNQSFSVVWTGYIEAPATGTYTFYSCNDDGLLLSVDGKRVIESFYYQGEPADCATFDGTHQGTVDLVAGQRYPIRVKYFQGGGGTGAHVYWQPPGATAMQALPRERLYAVW